MDDEEDTAFETEFHTDYGSGVEINSDYFSDGGLLFDSDFNPEDVISSFEHGSEGAQPFEFFREQRRSSRQVPSASDADHDYLPDAPSAMDEANAAIHVGNEASDRRSARRKAGHGRRARRRKPTRVSRGILPPQGDDLMQKANTEFMLGNFAQALPHLMECIKRYPNFTEPWMSLAANFESMGRHHRALHCYAIALHMKPSDDNIAKSCAEMSMTYGYIKQAIWAWSKYIRMKRREYEPQHTRLMLFVQHINAQSNPRQARRICAMAIHAANSMLRTFPGDCFASLKLPEFHYKAGESSKAIAFLEGFAEDHRASFLAEHVNMLAELHMHRRSFATALTVLQDLYGLDQCRESPDLAAKVSVCSLHCEDVSTATEFAAPLWELIPEENGTGHVTYDRADLFVDVAKAMAETELIAAGVTMLEKFLEEHQAVATELLNQDNEGPSDEQVQKAENKPELPTLQANLLDMLPFMAACSNATGNLDLALSAYELAYDIMDAEDAEYCNVMLSYVDILLLTQTDDAKARAASINAEVQGLLTNDAAAVRDIETQVKVIENWYQAGNDNEVEKCVARLLDTQSQLEQEEQQAKTKALSDVPLELQRRIIQLQRNPHLAARARQSAVRDAAADAAAESVPPNPELFWSNLPGRAPADPRTAPAAAAAADVEDAAHIVALQPGLAHREVAPVKDRRLERTRELDRQAIKVMDERSEELSRAGPMYKQGGKRLKHLAEHPGLFPILIQVLEARLEKGETDWVGKHVAELLGGSRRSTGSQQLRCNRTRLMMLGFRCRLEAGASQPQTHMEQKHIFSAWPHSVQAWNLFTRWCHLRNHVPKSVHRLHESFPDSLPLLLLRGHIALVAGQTVVAIKTYFEAFKMLPENAIISLCIGAAYLTYATSRSVGDRHAAILKAFAFLTRYAARAGSPAEAAYNLGRAFHHLDLLHLAAEWYNRCLALAVAARQEAEAGGGTDTDGDGDSDAGAGVTFECAHNLALIYEGSGASALAARVRATYCAV